MAAWFNYVYFAYGGELTDSSGKLAIDKDACVQGLTIWDTMNKEGLFEPNVTAGDFTAQTKSLVSGRRKRDDHRPVAVRSYATDGPNTKYWTFQIPTGTTQATVGVTDAYVIFKDTKNRDAAIAFTEFLMDPAGTCSSSRTAASCRSTRHSSPCPSSRPVPPRPSPTRCRRRSSCP